MDEARRPSLSRADAQVATDGSFPQLALLLLVASLLFFCRLRSPLLEPEEVRYAEVPRQMQAADRWVVPVLHGQDYLDKPPLFYWLVMTSYGLFGVHEWAARLVAGLVGVLTVAVVYGWGRRVLGPRAALAGALVLCLCPEFVYRGRMVTTNGLLGLWTTAALAAGHVARTGPRLHRGWWLAAGAATGLGLLTKGPVALALVAPPLGLAGWLDRRLARVGVRGWAGFLAAAVLVAAPWYVEVARRCPAFAGYFFWFHNVVRYTAPFDHAKPVWFYLPQLLLGLLPWTLLLVPLARLLTRRRRRPAAVRVALLAAGWGVLFFSLAGSKRPVYLVPVLPPLALALGGTIDLLLPRPRLAPAWDWLWRHRSALAYRTAAVALAMGLVGGGLALAVGVGQPGRVVLLAGLSGLGLVALARRERRASWLLAGGATFAVLWSATHDLLPDYARRFSLKRAARAPLAMGNPAVPVYCYPRHWDAVSFYLCRDDVRAFPAERRVELLAKLQERPDALLFVKTTHLKDLLADLPPGLEFLPAGQGAGVTAGRVRPRREAPPAAVYARAGG
jgi:4-amino-4-deoxy-L-arabinose transferase-like glycosyltransferase